MFSSFMRWVEVFRLVYLWHCIYFTLFTVSLDLLFWVVGRFDFDNVRLPPYSTWVRCFLHGSESGTALPHTCISDPRFFSVGNWECWGGGRVAWEWNA